MNPLTITVCHIIICLHLTTNVIYNPDNIIEKKITNLCHLCMVTNIRFKFTVLKINGHPKVHCACMGNMYYNRAAHDSKLELISIYTLMYRLVAQMTPKVCTDLQDKSSKRFDKVHIECIIL